MKERFIIRWESGDSHGRLGIEISIPDASGIATLYVKKFSGVNPTPEELYGIISETLVELAPKHWDRATSPLPVKHRSSTTDCPHGSRTHRVQLLTDASWGLTQTFSLHVSNKGKVALPVFAPVAWVQGVLFTLSEGGYSPDLIVRAESVQDVRDRFPHYNAFGERTERIVVD